MVEVDMGINEWKEAITEACFIAHIGWDDTNPFKSVNDLINWHIKMVLDPCVSEDAQRLIDIGSRQGYDKAINILHNGMKNDKD